MTDRFLPPRHSWLRHWQSAAIGLILVSFLTAWAAAWIVVRGRVAAQADYYLTADQIDLTPRPPWIRSDVKAEVLRDASLDRPLSLLDDQLTRRIYEVFPVHPWIARVQHVTKRYPPRLAVDVVYRRPVCMVEVEGPNRAAYPVDVESVLLPSGDFSAVDAARFPLLRGIDTPPQGVGSAWGDQRVLEGARLAAALADVWIDLELASLAPLPRTEDAAGEPQLYQLTTRSGIQILWGLPPKGNPADQALTEAKLARLRESLRSPLHRARPRTIYLEDLDAMQDKGG